MAPDLADGCGAGIMRGGSVADQSDADPEPYPACHFDVDPGPTFHFDAVPDPDLDNKGFDTLKKCSNIFHSFCLVNFELMLIWIQI
jgi:hypothetical protein